MFKEGDLIKRKKEHIDGYWEGVCVVNRFERYTEFVVLCHLPDQKVVRIKTPNGGELGVYDFKMELVDISLENE